MKNLFFVVLFTLLFTVNKIQSQTNTFPTSGSAGIGTTSPNASSLLEMSSTSKGFLAPRMTFAQRNAIASPATGLLIYQTNNTPGFYVFNGIAWTALNPLRATTTLNNLSAITAINNSLLPGIDSSIDLGSPTKAWRKLYLKDTVAIGTTTPTSLLDVNGTTKSVSFVSKDTSMFGSRVGIFGPTDSTYALTVNATYNALAGVLVTDPINNYGFRCDKTGAFEAIVGTKSSTSSNTPVIGGYNYGNGNGVNGFSNTGTAISGTSNAKYGVYGSTNNANSFAGYFNGSVFSTGSFQTSDARLKKNINNLEGGMDIINQLQPKTYQFRNDGNYAKLHLPTGNHIGLLAQDVEKVLPEAVKYAGIHSKDLNASIPKEDDKGEMIDFKAVNYTELIPIMIKALQEQDAKIKALTEMVQKLTLEAKKSIPLAIQTNEATLDQNIPNPVSNNNTKIQFNIPRNALKAELIVFDTNGKRIKSFNLSHQKSGSLEIDTRSLSAGAYTYSLVVDGKIIETKKMFVATN